MSISQKLQPRLKRTVQAVVTLLGVLAIVYYFWVWKGSDLSAESRISSKRLEEECPNLEIKDTNQGFKIQPVEGTILMLFSPKPTEHDSKQYCYDPKFTARLENAHQNRTGANVSCLHGMRDALQQSFLQVSAAFLTDPTSSTQGSPFYDFFRAHGATFWEVSPEGVATPFRFDIIYTYVNPAAPSMAKNRQARGLGEDLTQRRYNDWEELRYSFRGLMEFILNSDVLHQGDTARLKEDEVLLKDLGLRTVHHTADTPTSLVRRVILLLADADQVPEWLEVEKLPGLEVVTHTAMYQGAENAFVLPTFNSNAIEAGLHRIPGLSEFFLYFNNDMFVTRKISMFDLFRPLSPPRQELHFVSMVSNEGHLPERLLECRLSTGHRTLAFMEPIIHNYGKEDWFLGVDGHPRADGREEKEDVARGCLRRKGQEAIRKIPKTVDGKSLNLFANVPGLDSREALGFPFPLSVDTVSGLGVSIGWYLSLMRNRINGFDGPSGLAHIPQLLHRGTANGLTEHDFFWWTNATRAAVEREGFPFSTVDVYAGYALGMVRARERFLWNQLTLMLSNSSSKTAIGDLGDMIPWANDLKGFMKVKQLSSTSSYKYSNERVRVENTGPLYGKCMSASLQGPKLFETLAFWWLPAAAPSPVSGFRIRQLKGLYDIPSVRSGVAGTCPKWSWGGWLSSSSWYSTVLNEQYFLLYQDARHHLEADRTFHFEMMEGGMKPLAVLGRLLHDEKQGQMSTWYNLNDNFHDTGDRLARETQGAMFKILMSVVNRRLGAGPWEKDLYQRCKKSDKPKS